MFWKNGGIDLGGGNFPIPVALKVGTEGPDKKKVLEGGKEEKKEIATTGGGQEKKEEKCEICYRPMDEICLL